MNEPPPPLLFSDPCFLLHQTGQHPESPERLRHLSAHLEHGPVLARFKKTPFEPALRPQLERVHTAPYVDSVKEFAAKGGGRIEADTVLSRDSFDVATRAAGAALAAVDAVIKGPARRALCLIRPPGHHALAGSAMGFCLFNNVAVAAAHALAQHKLERVLIVDWDVHHGNGTQNLFYDSESVYFFSIHRHPFYPGTGLEEETGRGRGLGTKFNLPTRMGIPRKTYLERFQTTLEKAAGACKPQLVLLSAGFDAHAADPVGSLGLETEDFEPMTKLICQVADQHSQGRLVSLLEGGYNVRALAECVECHMEAMAGKARG
jgi:acetoin utilization deacetylase AcuC-like enzyme